jgi:integrase
VAKKRRRRLYWKRGRAYGDFRDYADVGGKTEALIRDGERYATEDEDAARVLIAERLKVLQRRRKDLASGIYVETGPIPTLSEFVDRHLRIKAINTRASTIRRDALYLPKIIPVIGKHVRLDDTRRIRDGTYKYISQRLKEVKPQSLRQELYSLSSLFETAISERFIEDNPIRGIRKPESEDAEAVYLEIDEGARVLRAAKELDADSIPAAIPYAHPLTATYLYTGCRRREGFGLECGDIDFRAQVVHLRPNRWRQLKRKSHKRTVPLWPDLEEILSEYLEHFDRREGLLFPSPKGGGMLSCVRVTLERVTEKAGVDKHVTLHTFRHTYTATRLQTLDHGQPVSPYTVMRELGHKKISLIENTYGHLLNVRHREPVLRYQETEVVPIPVQRVG